MGFLFYGAIFMRMSFSQVAGSFEAGHTSNWVVQFEKPSGALAAVPEANLLNLISDEFTPALDVEYDQHNVITKELVIGPGIKINLPVLLEECQEVTLTLYEEHKKIFRSAIRDWVTGLNLKQGKAPKLSELINSCLILKIYHFDKSLKKLDNRSLDAYYVMPSAAITFRGDQAFQLETMPLTFTVLGRYSDL